MTDEKKTGATSNNTHVLLVGVNDYDNEPAANLLGCRNDVISWWRLCVGYLNVPASQITVLASPPLTPEELVPNHGGALRRAAKKTKFGDATEDSIRQHFTSLSERVNGVPHASGLFTFSGHGTTTETGDPDILGSNLALCPQDTLVSECAREHLLDLIELERILQKTKPAHEWGPRVTMVLDACYTRGSRAFPKSPKKPQRPPANKHLDVRQLGVQGRLIMASQEWAPAYEIVIEGNWQGSCSWTMTRLLERWSLRRNRDAGVNYFNVSYHDIVHHTVDALSLFGVKQTPVMWGERLLDETPFLYAGARPTPGGTSSQPDRVERGRQIPVNPTKIQIYELIAVSDTAPTIAWGIVAGDHEDARPFNITLNDGQTVSITPGIEFWLYRDTSKDPAGYTELKFRRLATLYWSDTTAAQAAITAIITSNGLKNYFVVAEESPTNTWNSSGYSPTNTLTFFAACEKTYGDPIGIGIEQNWDDEANTATLNNIILYAPQSYIENASGGTNTLLWRDDDSTVADLTLPVIANAASWSDEGTRWAYYSYGGNISVGQGPVGTGS